MCAAISSGVSLTPPFLDSAIRSWRSVPLASDIDYCSLRMTDREGPGPDYVGRKSTTHPRRAARVVSIESIQLCEAHCAQATPWPGNKQNELPLRRGSPCAGSCTEIAD
ncbi:hypothetical protein GOALK_048_00260 [Gordonia alkanivorans NBRC 16433]|uniref:Uncharacterized protein n=1 Tax=Gordonia alkanivorans NBRC 16433 TaxID=1027371 RepID=F9VTX5_9ACTN|nr:hypothetical protein GOALK_048_00260 [Gordonia alkanivorans NBRC 16433]